MAALKALTANGLFSGQTPEFFALLSELAQAADAAGQGGSDENAGMEATAATATTLLLYFAARRMWKWSRIRAGALCVIPLAVEGAFFTGNTLKVLHGGWLPVPADDHMEERALSPAQELSANAFAHRPNHLDNGT